MKQNLRTQRQLASNELVTPDGTVLQQQVVVITDGRVTSWQPLVAEQAHTEWLQGRITLREDASELRAYYKEKLLT